MLYKPVVVLSRAEKKAKQKKPSKFMSSEDLEKYVVEVLGVSIHEARELISSAKMEVDDPLIRLGRRRKSE